MSGLRLAAAASTAPPAEAAEAARWRGLVYPRPISSSAAASRSSTLVALRPRHAARCQALPNSPPARGGEALSSPWYPLR